MRQAEVSGGQWAWPNANNQRVTFQFVNRRQIVCVARRLHKLLQRGNEATRQVGNLPAAVPSAVVVVVAATLGQVMHTCLAKLS